MQEKFTENRNFFELRRSRSLTLSQLSELTGYSIATLNALELKGEGSHRLKEKVLSVLLENQEGGLSSQVNYWRDRCLAAEEKLKMMKSAMQGLLKKI